jgi:hypothetical protein
MFLFTPFDCSDTCLHRVPSVHSLAKEAIKEEGEGKKLKGDGQSIGQGDKREEAPWPPWRRADVIVLLTSIS